MDLLRDFLQELKQQGQAQGRFLGLLHLLIGRRITRADGSVVTSGLAWRDLAAHLKKVRWDKQSVRELGLEPGDLPPRDRERYWYAAIARAQVDSEKAVSEGEALAESLRQQGYVVPPRK
jgi:hypothetical protein